VATGKTGENVKNEGVHNKKQKSASIDYQIPITQLRGVRGKWRYASSKAHVPKIAHHAT